MRGLPKSRGQEPRVKSSILLLFAFAFILCGMVLLLWGCSSYEQPGETAAEGSRRHQRVLRINQQEMMTDIDRALLLDQPRKLTDLRIP